MRPLLPASACLVAVLAAAPAAPARASDLEERARRQDARVAAEGFDAVAAEARERVAKDRGSAEARYLLGRLLGNEGNRLREQGKDEAAKGRVEEARVQFQGALELDFTYAPAWRGMAKVHLFLGEAETAVREARKALELDGGSLEGRVLLAECLYQKGDRPAAYEVLSAEIAKDPANNGLRLFLASLLYREQRFREAEAEMRVVVARDPADRGARHLLVRLLAATGRGSEARDACREAVKAIPGDTDFLFLLRGVCIDTGDIAGAIEADEALLRADLPEATKAELRKDLEQLREARDRPGEPGEGPGPEELVARLKSPDVAVRREAAEALASLPPESVPRAAATGVTDADEVVRLFTVRALARGGDPAAAGLFETLLFHPQGQDRSNAVRAAAARGLGKLRSAAALPVLLRAVEEQDADILRAAVEGIAAVTGFSVPADPLAPVPEAERPAMRAAYRRWWGEHPTGLRWRKKAAAAVGASGMRSLALYLVPWLEHGDAAIRASVLEAMAALTREDGWRSLPHATEGERRAAMDRAYERLGRPLPGGR